MSPRSSSRKPKVSPEPDIYVGLLTMSVFALFFGIMFLWLELSAYNFQLP